MPLASRIEIALLCDTSDTGDRTYAVVSKISDNALKEHPHMTALVSVLHDSHYAEAALMELRRAARAAVAGRLDAIRTVRSAQR